MKVLVVGPSDTKGRGGMSSVIKDIRTSKLLNEKFRLDVFASCIDGNAVARRLYSVGAYLKFLSVCKHYDVIHIHAASRASTLRKGLYLNAAKRRGKKVILHIHGARYMTYYEAASEAMQKKIVEILHAADLVVALSDTWKQTFEEAFGLRNCVSVENGVDTEALAPASADNAQTCKNFVCLGRLGQRKGTYDLVAAMEKAVKEVPDMKLYLAGDGEVEQVKALIAEKGLQQNIDVVGWIGFERKMELLKACATVVLPSYNEGLPMAVLEGMACGKAIISTPVGAIGEVVKPENGILITPGDVDALTDALVRFAKEPQLLRQMAVCNAQKIKDQYSTEAMHKKLAALYERVGTEK